MPRQTKAKGRVGAADGDSGTPAAMDRRRQLESQRASGKLENLHFALPVIHDEDPFSPAADDRDSHATEYAWPAFYFLGIVGSFVCYGLLEYATSGG